LQSSESSRAARSAGRTSARLCPASTSIRCGRLCGRLDHFGMTVDDVNVVMERAHKEVPKPTSSSAVDASIRGLQRAMIPTATCSTRERTRASATVYADQADEGRNPNASYKFAIRTLHAEKCATSTWRFRSRTLDKKTSVPGYHLTDGRVMLSILPWSIPGVRRHGDQTSRSDHIGFKARASTPQAGHCDVIGGCSYLAPDADGRSQGIGCTQGAAGEERDRQVSADRSGRRCGSTSPTSEFQAVVGRKR